MNSVVFGNYFINFNKHPELALQNQDEIVAKINEVFDAMIDQNRVVNLKGRDIHWAELGSKAKKVFLSFAKKFLQKAPLTDPQLESTRSHLHALNKIGKYFPLLEKRIFLKQNLQLLAPNQDNAISVEAQNRLTQGLTSQQIELSKLEEKAATNKLPIRIIGTLALAGVAVGVGFGIATLGIVPMVIVAVIASLIAIGILTGLWLPWPSKSSKLAIENRLKEVERLSHFKKVAKEPAFEQFANNNNFAQLKTNHLYTLIELYQLEKNFHASLQAAKEGDNGNRPSKQSLAVELNKVNQTRESLRLNKLPVDPFLEDAVNNNPPEIYPGMIVLENAVNNNPPEIYPRDNWVIVNEPVQPEIYPGIRVIEPMQPEPYHFHQNRHVGGFNNQAAAQYTPVNPQYWPPAFM